MEDFVPYELAIKLKEKGFKEKCYKHYYPNSKDWFISSSPECGNYSSYLDAPTIFQVLKWLRKEKKIFVAINISYCYESDEIPFPTNPKMESILKGYYYGIWELDNLNDKNACSEYFKVPELAAIAGIEYVIDKLI